MNATKADCTLISMNDSPPPGQIVATMEAMSLRKDLYDLHHPEHRKRLSVTDLWRIARHKVMEELSAPPRTDALSAR